MPTVNELPVKSPETVTALRTITGADGLAKWQTDFDGALGAADGQGAAQELLHEIDLRASVEGTETFAVAGGTPDAMIATFMPAITAPVDGEEIKVRALGANTTTAPTLVVNALPARAITKNGGQPLAVGDISGAGHELLLRYVGGATPRWELLNPSSGKGIVEIVPGAHVLVDTADPLKPVVDVAPLFQPINVSPVNGALISKANPPLVGDAYYSAFGIPQSQRDFQVDLSTGDFTAPAINYSRVPSTSGANDALSVLAVDCAQNSAYKWRYRDHTVKGGVGGWSPPTAFTTAPIFDLGGVYKQLNSGPLARYQACAASVGTSMYLFGGYRLGTRDTDLWRYDGPNNTWTQLADIPAAGRMGSTMVAIDGILYIHGGDFNGYTTELWSYNTITKVWARLADGPGRTSAAAVAIDGKMYVYGGNYATNLSDLWCYDPPTNTWTQLASCPGNGRYDHTAVAIGKRMYIHGGSVQFGYGKDTWYYDTTNNTWTEVADATIMRLNHVAAAIGGKMYVFGGRTINSAILNDLWGYDPSTNTWSQYTSGATAREFAAATVLSGAFFIFGGYDASSAYLDDLWEIN